MTPAAAQRAAWRAEKRYVWDVVAMHYSTSPSKDVAVMAGRSVSTVERIARELGLRKAPSVLASRHMHGRMRYWGTGR